MRTKTQNKLPLLGQVTLIVALLFAARASAITKAFEVNVRVRFVELQSASSLWKKFNWYPKGLEDRPLRVLSDTQLHAVLKALDEHDGADLLSDTQITTLSGRNVQLQPAGNGAPINPDLGIEVKVSSDGSDGFAIRTLMHPHTVFLTSQPFPLPHSRVRTLMHTGKVKDGETLVLGGLSPDLLIFVTPTVINASVNATHSKDYYDGTVQ